MSAQVPTPDAPSPVSTPARKARGGSKPKGQVVLTAAQRTAAWRANNKMVTVEVHEGVAARLRQVRDALDGTMGEALAAVLKAYAAKGKAG